LETFIAPDLYAPVANDPLALEFQHQRDKIIREVKRSWLHDYVVFYEIILQNNEQQYQRALHRFERNTSNNSHRMTDHGTTTQSTLFHSFTAYMEHRMNRIQREINVEKILLYRSKLLRIRRRQLWSSTNHRSTVNVSPQVIIDLINHPFNADEIAYLSRGE
jgi:hypothetical protein